nr:hypothetical protein PanWU01x14_251760 [Ipomoea batatas]
MIDRRLRGDQRALDLRRRRVANPVEEGRRWIPCSVAGSSWGNQSETERPALAGSVESGTSGKCRPYGRTLIGRARALATGMRIRFALLRSVGRRRSRSRSRSGGFRFRSLAFPAAAADGDVAEDAAFGPVPPAALTEVTRLREVVVIVIAKFGVERVASGALQRRQCDKYPFPNLSSSPNYLYCIPEIFCDKKQKNQRGDMTRVPSEDSQNDCESHVMAKLQEQPHSTSRLFAACL